ncbi:15965_t:CDS:2, partial [Funneliformis geosporum]
SQDRFLETKFLPIHEFTTKLHEKITQEDYEYTQKLDPSYYVSLSALSWDSMLKMTRVKIELLTDIAMYDFIEKAKYSKIAITCQRYFKANNPKI